MAYNQQQLSQMIGQLRSKGLDEGRIRNAVQNTLNKQSSMAQSQPQQQAAPQKQPSLLTRFAPLLGSVGGGIAGGLAAGPFGVIAGGAAGGAAGEKYRQKQSGEQQNIGNIVKEGAFGALGGLGEGIQAIRGISTAAKVAKTASAASKAAKGLQVAEEATQIARGAGMAGRAENALRSSATALEQGTRQIRVPASVYGAAKENAINATLSKYGIRGTAQAQYEQLAPTIAKIEGKITQVAKANPTAVVSANELRTSFMSNLKSALRSGVVEAKPAQQEVAKYLGDLAAETGSTGGKFNLQQLRDMKKLINTDMAGIAKKLETGITLTPREQVINVSWQSIDDSLKGMSPEIKALLKDQSHLYAADSSLSRARTAPPTFRVAGTSIPMPVVQAGRELGSAALNGGANAMNAAGRLSQSVGPSVSRGIKVGIGQQMGNAVFGDGQEQPQDQMQQDQQPSMESLFPDQGGDSQDMMSQLFPDQGGQVQQASFGGQQGMQGQVDPQQQQQMFLAAMMQDLQTTGGKNLAKIQAIASFAQKASEGVTGKSKKPMTASQSKANGYANRLQQANDIFDKIAPRVTDTLTKRYSLERKVPAALKGGVFKQQDQAERNFVNAILRQESGAAIAPSEFASASEQYFPQPGDTREVLAQKAQNRLMAIENLRTEANGTASNQIDLSQFGL